MQRGVTIVLSIFINKEQCKNRKFMIIASGMKTCRKAGGCNGNFHWSYHWLVYGFDGNSRLRCLHDSQFSQKFTEALVTLSIKGGFQTRPSSKPTTSPCPPPASLCLYPVTPLISNDEQLYRAGIYTHYSGDSQQYRYRTDTYSCHSEHSQRIYFCLIQQ